MGISYYELKYGILSEDDLTALLKGFDFDTEEAGWTIVKYVVRDGDTISGLSARFKIPQTLILRLNDLSPGATIKQGEILLLPEPYT
ncbi:MAG TPA: LysM peptidoglycan-binding domain-containing protein [Firmicutes bacterium]|uniref:LysM peptidoglycan-binding domain-containing protein n=1 Tax=Capillibacterium thermochitinicola TaxID=2699427 RepID=A0A8J6LS30_9FIRM|nr:LysM domain-containing protein [Capillibacterium thermochitinicola]MBA2132917.1 LysM peptidoglycan-binding domain-containing protein [Capillibacterium thermochitinicola]HHW11775.1 LysM peptidoglycan-binding domain-containing protein [Bacillota bacterium]